jgi:hypothetical protein
LRNTASIPLARRIGDEIKMKAEELARLWQDGLREAYGEGQEWDRLSDQQKAINIRVATKVLEHFTIKEDVQWMQDNIWHPQLGAHAACISSLQRQVKVLHDEIFCT